MPVKEISGTGNRDEARIDRQQLVARLRIIDDLSGLSAFVDEIGLADAFSAAIAHACKSHLQAVRDDASDAFNAGRFLAEDLSAVRPGGIPAIFLGSNEWALLRFATSRELDLRIGRLLTMLNAVIDMIDVPVHLIVVPEKDVLVEKIFRETDAPDPRDDAIRQFFTRLERPGLTFGHDGFIPLITERTRQEDYSYSDSHLLSRDYLHIFYRSLEAFGLLPSVRGLGLELLREPLYGDLAAKFSPPDPSPQPFLMPSIGGAPPEQVAGSETFENPLRSTTQSFQRPSAPIDARVAIYGDSHSSVLAMRKLTFLYAHAFRHCRFDWDPLHLNQDPGPVDADFVVFEISERFLFGAPLSKETGA